MSKKTFDPKETMLNKKCEPMKASLFTRKLFIALAAVLAVVFFVGCKPTEGAVKKYVKKNVPEPCTLISTGQHEQFGNTQYEYTFKSDLREMQFIIYYSYSNDAGWHYVNGYSTGLTAYYREDVYAAFATSPSYKRDYDFIVSSEEDLSSIAQALAKANEVVADQWNYDPDAVIGRYDSVDMGGILYRENEEKSFWYYDLNGIDVEETIYSKLVEKYNQ